MNVITKILMSLGLMKTRPATLWPPLKLEPTITPVAPYKVEPPLLELHGTVVEDFEMHQTELKARTKVLVGTSRPGSPELESFELRCNPRHYPICRSNEPEAPYSRMASVAQYTMEVSEGMQPYASGGGGNFGGGGAGGSWEANTTDCNTSDSSSSSDSGSCGSTD